MYITRNKALDNIASNLKYTDPQIQLINDDTKPITLSQLKSCTPRNLHYGLNDDLVNNINECLLDTDNGRVFRENFISYLDVLKGTKSSLKTYLDAIKFVTYKLLGNDNVTAYKKTFPDRIDKYDDKHLSNKANQYCRTQMVVKILQQTIIPSYILNAPLHQKALSILGQMIEDPHVKGMAKVKACETILNFTKPPEIQKSEMKIELVDNDAMLDLKETTNRLATMFKQGLQNGNITLDEIIDVNFSEEELSNDK